jgi:hypothetical protein
MFLNNASALATRTPRLHPNNENANTVRAKSLASSENVTAMKTPKTKDLGTQQRRRRALGDISNRKNGLGGTSNKNGGLVLKPQQSTMKPKVSFSTPSTKQGRPSSLTILKPQTPAIHIDPIQEFKNEVQHPIHDYEAVLGRTTRWSTEHDDDLDRSPFDFMSKEELFMVDTVRDEIMARERKEMMDEQRRMELAYEEKLRDAVNCWNAGLEDASYDVPYDDEDISLLLRSNSWEESDDSDDVVGLLDD